MRYLKNSKVLHITADLFLIPFTITAALILLFLRKLGIKRLKRNLFILRKIKVYPIISHYYEPEFNQVKELHNEFSNKVLFNEVQQLKFLGKLNCESEIKILNSKNENLFSSSSFGTGDTEFYYQFLRHTKPKKIIEIGSGSSTKIALEAIEKNYEDTGFKTIMTCIEPYESEWLNNENRINLIREKVELTNIDWNNELNEGDVLFIDSTHIANPYGDVHFEYTNTLPLLRSGVFIHIHDIFLPKFYPESWFNSGNMFWNEQIILEVILLNSNRYEVISSLNWLKHNHFKKLKLVCPLINERREPGSFYMRVN